MSAEAEKKAPTPKRARKPKPPRLQVSHLGPIKSADVAFKDLTVIVGPQATGKSIFLQTLKLLVDRDQIHDTFKRHGMSFNDKADAFMEGYFGRGLASAWGAQSNFALAANYQGIPITWDPNCVSGRMYFLNKKGLKVRMLGNGWELMPFESTRSNGIDARVALLRCFVATTVSHRRIQGQISTIT